MKKVKKLACTAMAALLTLSMCVPASAGSDTPVLEKNETVYTVLNPDGSVESQIVSVHLHRDGGLSGAKDQSTLSEIECTDGEGGFTQDGETLTWNVAEPDAYYKGSTQKASPIEAKITYSLDGRTAPLDELLGKSGKLKITIDFVNHETSTVQIQGKSRQICTPFATLAAAVFEENCSHIKAEHGRVEKLSGRQIAGFVCLPGVKDSLDGVLPDQLGDLESYLLDQVVVEADVEELTAPTILIACAADASLLAENDEIDGLEDLDGLQDDMDRLSEAMEDLIDGASQLSDGAAQLTSGVHELESGVGELDDGASKLNGGTSALQEGADALRKGSASARDGAGALKEGADQLSAGLASLQSGAGALTEGYQQLQSGSASLTAGLNTLTEKNESLNAGAKQVSDGAAALVSAIGPEGQISVGSKTFSDALSGASSQGTAALEQLPAPQTYAQLLQAAGVPAEQQTALLAAYQGAYDTATGLSTGMAQLNTQYAALNSGIQQAAQGAAALNQGAASLSQGVAGYTQGAANASAGANSLNSGLTQLGQQLPTLTGGIDNLAAGANQLSAGAANLQAGNSAVADGASQLAAGIGELSTGTDQLALGIKALVEGAAELASGTVRLNDGAKELKNGLVQFDEEGISKLTESIDPQQLSDLKEIISKMQEGQKNYGSFSGTPEQAETSVKFIMKTSEPKQAAAQQDVPADQDTPQKETASFWDRFLGLFKN